MDLEITQLVDCPGISLESEHGGCSCLYAALDRMAVALREEERKPRLSIDQARILDSWALESAAAKARIRDLESESEHLSSALSISENEVATTHQTALRLKEAEQENVSLREQIREERGKAQSAENESNRLSISLTRTLDWTEDSTQKSKEKITQLEELVESLNTSLGNSVEKLEKARLEIKRFNLLESQQEFLKQERDRELQEIRSQNTSLQENAELFERAIAEKDTELFSLRNLVKEQKKSLLAIGSVLKEKA